MRCRLITSLVSLCSLRLRAGAQVGDSLWNGWVGLHVISRGADILAVRCPDELPQERLASSRIAAGVSEQCRGEGVRLEFLVSGEGATQQFPSRLIQPGAGGQPAG